MPFGKTATNASRTGFKTVGLGDSNGFSFPDGFAAPLVLAFQKTDHAVPTFIASNGIDSDAYLSNTRGAMMAWFRLSDVSVTNQIVSVMAANGSVPSNADFTFLGTGVVTTSPQRVSTGYSQDGGSVFRSVLYVTTASLADQWHAIYGDKDLPSELGQTVLIDNEVGASTARGSEPNEDVPDFLTLFGDFGIANNTTNRVMSGLITRPVMFLGGPDHKADFPAYFADAGQGLASIYTASDVKAAPYPIRAGAGKQCRVRAVDASGNILSGVTVIGLPSAWRGPGEGWNGIRADGNHYAYAAWPDPPGRTGMTIMVEIQIDALSGNAAPDIIIGRRELSLGGMRLGIEGTALALRLNSFILNGGTNLNETFVSVGTLTLGTRAFIAFTSDENAGAGQSIIVGVDGTIHVVNDHTFTPRFNSDGFIAGRGRITSGNNNWDRSYGTIYRVMVIPATVTATDIQAIAAGGALPSGSVDIAGFESNTIEDLADSIRGDGKRRLWGVLDTDRSDADEKYDSDIPTVINLSDSTITVGT